jgi:hypothetical protein
MTVFVTEVDAGVRHAAGLGVADGQEVEIVLEVAKMHRATATRQCPVLTAPRPSRVPSRTMTVLSICILAGPDSVSELSEPDTVESLSLESSAVSSVRRLEPVSDDLDFLSVGHAQSRSMSYPSIHFGNEDDPSRPTYRPRSRQNAYR